MAPLRKRAATSRRRARFPAAIKRIPFLGFWAISRVRIPGGLHLPWNRA